MKRVRRNLGWSVFTIGMLAMYSAALAQLEATETVVEKTEAANAVRALPLEEAYRLALANEEQIKIAGRELTKAQLLPWRAIAQLTPRADVTGTYTRNKEELAFVFPEGFGSRAGTASAIRPLVLLCQSL